MKKAFTLVEMTVVMAIIAILAGITLVNLGSFIPDARNDRRLADTRTLKQLLILYNQRYGSYPAALTGASGLSMVSNSFPTNDPQGNAYNYVSCGGAAPGFLLYITLERQTPGSGLLTASKGAVVGSISCGTQTVDCASTPTSPAYYCLTE